MRRSVRKKHTSENFIQPKKAVGRRHPNDSIFESGVGNVAKQYAHGNIIKKLGYDENLSDFIYQVYCFSFKPPKKVRWSHKSLEKIS